MRWMWLPSCVALATACGGFFNPKFNEGGTEGESESGTSSTSTSSSTSSSSSGSASSSTISGGESESGASSSTTGVDDTTTEASTSDDTTTGEPVKTAYCDGEDPVAQVTLDEFLCSFVGDAPLLACLTPTSWGKAKSACEAMCGRLVVAPDDPSRVALYDGFFGLLTPEEQGMVTIDGQPSVAEASTWVGACAAEAVFTWIDGTPMPAAPGMFGWGPQDPDEPPSSCVVMVLYGKGGANGYWHDRTPNLLYRFACEAA